MTLKEELEILRGEPIEVFTGKSMDIPCIETSDAEKLCRHPVVSVQMITYNHEPYIRQAIEGVMMQKTDFEFELVIGEDCSQDKTREICFEYQKKYPDKIRVFWWHENVSKLGGNGRRTRAHCRGEFIALCEGDDYWIDPLKLQKQVDIMRQHLNVSFCFCRAKIRRAEPKEIAWGDGKLWVPGVIPGRDFMLRHIFGLGQFDSEWPEETFLMTSSVLIRASAVRNAASKFEVLSWRMFLGDTTLWLGLASLGDAYFCPDVVSVYNQLNSGACRSSRGKVGRDAEIVRLFYCIKSLGIKVGALPTSFIRHFYEHLLVDTVSTGVRCQVGAALKGAVLRRIVFSPRFFVPTLVIGLLGRSDFVKRFYYRFVFYVIGDRRLPRWLRKEYVRMGIRLKGCDTLLRRLISGLKKLKASRKESS